MSGILSLLLGVMLLLENDRAINAEAEAAREEDDRIEPVAKVVDEKGHEMRIRSTTSDLDRQNGVILFEGNVRVDYSSDYTMCADQLYAFLSSSNDLRRVVAIGNVAITNDVRSGSCARAVYRRTKREIEMFGDGKEVFAVLRDSGDENTQPSVVEGGRIKFWLDSEQVEVEDSRIQTEGSKGGEKFL